MFVPYLVFTSLLFLVLEFPVMGPNLFYPQSLHVGRSYYLYDAAWSLCKNYFVCSSFIFLNDSVIYLLEWKSLFIIETIEVFCL